MAILQATAAQFAERGYDGLSMEGIAAAAGVGKQTIYRWWSSKAALVADCLIEGLLLPDHFAPVDTGDLRGDFVAWLDLVLDFFAQPANAGLVRSLVAAATADDAVATGLQERIGGASALGARLAAGIAAGQLRADAPVAEIIEAFVGFLTLRALSPMPVPPGTAHRLVDALLTPSAGGETSGRETGSAGLAERRSSVRDVVYLERPGFRPLALDLHLPPRSESDAAAPLVVFVHGGGWQQGSRRDFGPEILDAFERIAAAGFAVASVDYRLSAEAVFPAQVDDVVAAIGWLRARAPQFRIAADRVVLWGESAGATIASLTALELLGTDAPPRGVVHWYGPTDLIDHARLLGRTTDPECAEARWLGATAGERPDLAAAASPALRVRAELVGVDPVRADSRDAAAAPLPPFLIVNGTADTAVPHSQAESFAKAIDSAGGEVELVLVDGAGHRFEGDVDRDALLEQAIAFAGRVV